jgi:cyclic beta-1,2-glucan synthetase
MVQTPVTIETPRPTKSERIAIELAENTKEARPRRGPFPVPIRLRRLNELFKAAYNHFEAASKTQAVVSSASEWLLDNFYILEQALRVVEEDLPKEYYALLPKTADGWTRIQILTLGLTNEGMRLDLERIKGFVQAFQGETPLRVGELWALPLLLRLSILETLATGLAEITKLAWEPNPEPAIWGQLKTASDANEADPETKVINSILNLRLIATMDWKEFFEATSLLEAELSQDPAGVYSGSTFDTRNQYRGVVEELARGSSLSELEVARQLLALAASGSSQREQHVGYYLIAEGRPALERQIRFRPPEYVKNSILSMVLGFVSPIGPKIRV